MPALRPISKPQPPGDGFMTELSLVEGETRLTKQVDDLRNDKPLAARWKCVPVLLESCSPKDDFYLYGLGTFAVSEKARSVIASLAGDRVEFLPIEVVGIRTDDDGPVEKFSRSDRRKLYIVRPLELASLSEASRFSDLGAVVMVSRYAFKWDDVSDRHWFRASGSDETLVSDQLRIALEKGGLKGAQFQKAIKYGLAGQGPATASRGVAPPPMPPDFDELPKMRRVTKALWQNWVDHWNWVCDVIDSRGGDVVERPKIAKPLSKQKLAALKRKMGMAMPSEFEDVLTNYSSRVSLYWYLEDEQTEVLPEALHGLMGGVDALWDVAILPEMASAARNHASSGWLAFRDGLRGRLPFINVGNGDVIAFDMRHGTSNCPIVYLSHENDATEHDKQLAPNFIDFVTRWSYLGGLAVESCNLGLFYDKRAKRLNVSGSNARRWRKWLETGK
ncbi:MAG: SMI1/KNR4 family protein [Planctomycetaceae bacterium]|nr:SMI1/KNR4 family protein [Planctomycetaceae bacterium]